MGDSNTRSAESNLAATSAPLQAAMSPEVQTKIVDDNEKRLKILNDYALPYLRKGFVIAAVLIVLCFAISVIESGWLLFVSADNLNGSIARFEFVQKTLFHSLQIGAGLLLGYACIWIGVVLCWTGITSPTSLETTTPFGNVKLGTTQVGAVLFVGGVFLLLAAINRQVTTTSVERELLQLLRPRVSEKGFEEGDKSN